MDHYRRSSMNGFSAHSIDRMTLKRRDEDWIANQVRDSRSVFLPVWNSRNLFSDACGSSPAELSPVDLGDLLYTSESLCFLGEKSGRAYFAIGLSAADRTIPQRLSAFGVFEDLRRLGAVLGDKEASLLAYARAIVHWHGRHRFCGDCGSPTVSAEGGHVRVCTSASCAQQHFPRTDPAIIVLVSYEDRCLLGRQPIWPKGMYSTIAGFVEPGESLEAAVLREVMEETGIAVAQVCYYASQPWPFPASLMLGFTAKATTELIRLNDKELEDARWFSREDILAGLRQGSMRMPSTYSIAYRLIEHWFDADSPGELIKNF